MSRLTDIIDLLQKYSHYTGETEVEIAKGSRQLRKDVTGRKNQILRKWRLRGM